MGERGVGGHAAARRAHEEPLLEQVGLVDVLDRVGLLADRHRERRQAHRAAAELLADGAQDLAVEPVEPGRVDLEQVERLARHVRVDVAGAAHLGEVAHALEQPVGHARRAARARARSPRRPPSSISTPRMPAERSTIRARSAGSYSSSRCVTPKRSRSGVVSRPVRVVAPISVNCGRSSVTTRAPAPWPTVIGSLRSSIAG